MKTLILLMAGASLCAQTNTGGGGGSGTGCSSITGTPGASTALQGTGAGTACSWSAIGAASVDETAVKNAVGFVDTSVTANLITGTTPTTFPGAYAALQFVFVKLANTVTGTLSMNINSLGAKAVVDSTGAAVTTGLTAGRIYLFGYDGTSFQLIAGASGGGITALTGDVTATGPGSVAGTLATVNGSPGACGDATHVCAVTTNGKGLTTAQTATTIAITESQVTNLVSDLAAKAATGAAPSLHATTHAAGNTDPVTLTEAQITNLTTDLAAKQSSGSPNANNAGIATCPGTGATQQFAISTPAGTTANCLQVPATAVTGLGTAATTNSTAYDAAGAAATAQAAAQAASDPIGTATAANPSSTLPAGVTSMIIGNWPMTTCAGAAIANTLGTTVPDCAVGAYAGGINPGTLNNHTGSGQPTPSLQGLTFAAANKQTVDLTVNSMTGLKTFMWWGDVTPLSLLTNSYSPFLGTLTSGTGAKGAALFLRDLSAGTTGPNQFVGINTGQLGGPINPFFDVCTGVCAIEMDLHLSTDTPNIDALYLNGVQGSTGTSAATLSNANWLTNSGVAMEFGGTTAAGGSIAGYYTGTMYYALALNATPTAAQRGQINAYVQAILSQRGVTIGPVPNTTQGNILVCFGDSITMGTNAQVDYCQNQVATTVATTVASGVTSITVASGTGILPNMVLNLDGGQATAETVVTANGYTAGSATVTLAAATTQPHYAGSGGSVIAPFQNLDTTQGAWTFRQFGRPSMNAFQGLASPAGLIPYVASSQAAKQVAVIYIPTNGPAAGTTSPYTDMANIRALHLAFRKAGFKTVDVGMIDRGGNTNNGVASVTSVPITTPGACTVNPTFTITGGGGSGATLTGTFVSGVLVQINITAGGTAFTSTPTANVVGGTCTTFPVLGTPVITGTLNKQCSSTTATVNYGTGFLQCTLSSAAQTVSLLHGQYWPDFADAFVDLWQVPAFANGNATTNAAGSCMVVSRPYGVDTIHPSVCGQQLIAQYVQAGVERAEGREIGANVNQVAPTVTTATYQIPNSLFQTYVNPTGGSQVITLPSALAATGARYCVKNVQTSGANTATMATLSSQTIDTSGTMPLVANNTNTCWVSTGTNWTTR